MEFEPATEVRCPHCGESFTTFVDLSQGDSVYIEDCQVCCQPIQFNLIIRDLERGEFRLHVNPG
ncbi:MAG: CPXCG motif-containing cysteine-rich protein [Bdellovibrionales bacterium]|nr:CPXCG motif-containing cysteine-rich protein [Bdellovibrionales bacterium]